MISLRTLVNQHKNKDSVIQQIRSTKQVRMVGNSMLPILDPNDISVLFIVESQKYEIGDVVVFENKNSIPGFSVHRIIHLSKDKVITKGDNNLQSDVIIDRRAIIGKIEKAFYNDGSFHTVRTSKVIAWFSNLESHLESFLPKKILLFIHRLLGKIYFCFK